MVQQPGLRIADMSLDGGKLAGNIVEGTVFMEERCILRIERQRHIDPVQPHLLRVFLFMPETALRCAGLIPQLLP
jgi:hypothetical protein